MTTLPMTLRIFLLLGVTACSMIVGTNVWRITLPTVQDGMRLLPVGRELDHSAIMSKFSDRHNELVTEFLADYEAEATAAPVRLNGQGNDQ